MQEDYKWWPFKECSKILDESHYACFSHSDHSLKEPADDECESLRASTCLFLTRREDPIPVYDDQSLEDVYVITGEYNGQIVVDSVTVRVRLQTLGP